LFEKILLKITGLRFKKRFVSAAFAAAGIFFIVFASWNIIKTSNEDAAAVNEYDSLREMIERPPAPTDEPSGREDFISEDFFDSDTISNEIILNEPDDLPELNPAAEDEAENKDLESAMAVFAEEINAEPPKITAIIEPEVFTNINPDFVGWIMIPGTTIDYPVVRGGDNDKYLERTFNGKPNASGSIFIDYRCENNFGSPVCVAYGHNMKNGTMFAPLRNYYLDRDFIVECPEIIVLTAEGAILTYKIIGTRWTDAWNEIYTLDYNDSGAPAEFYGSNEFERLLVLSTCVGEPGGIERLLVIAGLEE